MLDELATIEASAKTKKALIIDKEVDFCFLIQYYLLKKNFEASITDNLTRCFSIIEKERPELIIADRKIDLNFEPFLKEKIESMEGYLPRLIFVDERPGEPEGAVIYTLRKDYYKGHYYKNDHHKSHESLWEKIIRYIKDLFK